MQLRTRFPSRSTSQNRSPIVGKTVNRVDPRRYASFAFVVFAGATILSILLPAKVDAVQTDSGVWWACVLGAGFDAAVNDRANRMSWPRGRRRYDLAVVAELGSYRPLPFVLHLDGERVEADAMLVALGNAPSYGGGMKVCPGAVMDDGLLEVVIVGPMSRTTFLRLFPRVFTGRHVTHPSVQVRRAASVSLQAPSANAYADGEPLGALPITSTVHPGALRVVGARPGA